MMKMLSIVFISSSFTTCFIEAGNYYGINPYILYAIAKVESGLNPYAVEVISKKKLSINCPYKYKNTLGEKLSGNKGSDT